MTEQEAINEIRNMECVECIGNEIGCGSCSYKVAINALEEIQQYRAIGTVEELKESKEQYDNINCAAKSIQLSGLCDFENAKRKIISEIKRNYEYSLRDYETIGTPDECREAVEKQTAKKPKQQGIVDSNGKFHTWNGINGKPYLLCPNCGTNLCCEMPYDKKPKYCDDCGQKLNWEDE